MEQQQKQPEPYIQKLFRPFVSHSPVAIQYAYHFVRDILQYMQTNFFFSRFRVWACDEFRFIVILLLFSTFRLGDYVHQWTSKPWALTSILARFRSDFMAVKKCLRMC